MAELLFDETGFSMRQITWFFNAIYRHYLIDKVVVLTP